MNSRLVAGVSALIAALGCSGAPDGNGVEQSALQASSAPVHMHEMKPMAADNAGSAPLAASAASGPSALTSYATYRGGPILQPEIVTMFWGNFTSDEVTSMRNYLASLISYTYGANAPAGAAPISAQYGVVGGRLGASLVDGSIPDGTVVQQSDLVNKLQSEQAFGSLPPWSDNRIFMVFTKGFLFSDGYGVSDGIHKAYCGYHTDRGRGEYFALVPYPEHINCAENGFGGYSAAEMFQVMASHEYFEAVTDPDIFLGWTTDDSDKSEIGDQCNWSYTSDNITRLPFGAIQLEEDNTTGGCDIWSYEVSPRITAVSPATNVIDYYALGGDQTVFHKGRTNSTWTPARTAAWDQLGTTQFVAQPITVNWGNQESIFGTGTDGQVNFKTVSGTTWNPSKTTWTNLGGPVVGNVAAVATGTNQIQLFAQNVFDSQYMKKTRDSSGNWSPSQFGWSALPPSPSGVWNGPPAAVRNGSGVSVIGWGEDGQYWSLDPGASSWSLIPDMPVPLITSPVVSSQSSTHFDVWALGNDYSYYHAEWTGSAWVVEALGGTLCSPPAAASWSAGHIDLFGQSFDGAFWTATRTASSGWGDWQPLGGVFLSGPSATVWGNTKLDVFGVGGDLTAFRMTDTNGTYTPTSGWDTFAGSLH